MFTGITRGTFPVVSIERQPDLVRYAVELPARLADGLEIGASVNIDGVCQTVVAVDSPGSSSHTSEICRATFEAIQETLERTTLGELQEGRRVSVERSFTVGAEIGGHIVSGHVSGTGRVAERHQQGDVFDLRIEIPAAWLRYVQEKGFIALDGSSLTVGAVEVPTKATREHSEGSHDDNARGSFWVHLIPETLRLTNFAERQPGDRVNVELDANTVAVVDTVERVLAERLPEMVRGEVAKHRQP